MNAWYGGTCKECYGEVHVTGEYPYGKWDYVWYCTSCKKSEDLGDQDSPDKWVSVNVDTNQKFEDPDIVVQGLII